MESNCMKITRMTTWRVEVDYSAWLGDTEVAGGGRPVWDQPIVRLDTDEGVAGHTMAFALSAVGAGNARMLHETYWSTLKGKDVMRHEALWQELRRANRHLYTVTDVPVGALDVALWDIRAKAAGLPLAALLGMARDRVPAYASISQGLLTPDHVAAEVGRIKSEGFRACKIQIWDGPERDIPRLEAGRAAAGPDFVLMHDGGGMYNYLEALEVGRALDRLNYYWYEEPVPDRQINILKRLAGELQTPILAAETVRLAELPEFLRQGALDIVRGDCYIKGGITGLRKALGMCELFGYNLEIHTGATPLLDAANLHAICSTENCRFAESHHAVFRFGMKGNPLEIDAEGYLHLPAGPGLGIELDWDWIDDHTVEVITSE
jgi:L-alanine-DL-glutamate epimerase-like enolase superfamily enzyme